MINMLGNLSNPEIVRYGDDKYKNLTTIQYHRMSAVEKLSYHMYLVSKQLLGEIECITEVLKEFETTEIEYRYEVECPANGDVLLFKNKEELCDYFNYENINKFWYDYRNGIGEQLSKYKVRRIKKVVAYDKDGNIVSEKEYATA